MSGTIIDATYNGFVAGGSAPTVISTDKALGDASGNTVITVRVNDSTGCTAIHVCGVVCTSFTPIDSTHVRGTTGAMTASSTPGDVTVTNGFGTGTLAGAFEAFWPTNISGCVQWLRGDLGITTSGGNTTVWADQSGHGFDMTNSTYGTPPSVPVAGINGKTAVPFNAARNAGAGDILAASAPVALSGAAAAEGFVVAQEAASPTNQSFWYYGNSSQGFYPFGGNVYDGFCSLSRYDTASNRGSDFPPLPDPTLPWLFNSRINASSFDVFINGLHMITAASPSFGVAPTVCTIGSAVGTLPMTGNINEVIIYGRSTILSSGERARLLSYKADRYAF